MLEPEQETIQMDTNIYKIAQAEFTLRNKRQRAREGYTVRVPNMIDKLAGLIRNAFSRRVVRTPHHQQRVAPAK